MVETRVFQGHLRRAGWTRVTHGVHAVGGSDPLVGWQLVLPPSGRFTHLTAAAALGWWVPPERPGLPVIAAVNRTDPRPRRLGLHVVRTDATGPPLTTDGFRLYSPEDILLACARDLGALDLVVLYRQRPAIGC